MIDTPLGPLTCEFRDTYYSVRVVSPEGLIAGGSWSCILETPHPGSGSIWEVRIPLNHDGTIYVSSRRGSVELDGRKKGGKNWRQLITYRSGGVWAGVRARIEGEVAPLITAWLQGPEADQMKRQHAEERLAWFIERFTANGNDAERRAAEYQAQAAKVKHIVENWREAGRPLPGEQER